MPSQPIQINTFVNVDTVLSDNNNKNQDALLSNASLRAMFNRSLQKFSNWLIWKITGELEGWYSAFMQLSTVIIFMKEILAGKSPGML